MMEVSRRDLLKGGTILAAGAAVTASVGMFGCATGGQSANTSHNGEPEKWDYEADIVVAGLGLAGLGAIWAAQENGLSVVVLEKMAPEEAGGAGSCFAATFAPMEPWWIIRNSYNYFSEDAAQKIADKSAAFCEMLEDLDGIELQKGSPIYGDNYRSIPEGGSGAYKALIELVNEMDNVTLLYETPITSLVKDLDSGEILGAEAQDANGNKIYAKGKRATLIATGGFEGNTELMQTLYCPKLPIYGEGGPARTGDGIDVALRAGAGIGNIAQCISMNLAFKKPSEELGGAVRSVAHTNLMWVNRTGKRFMSETAELGHNKTTRVFHEFSSCVSNGDEEGYNDYVNFPCWGVFDSETIKKGALGLGGTWRVSWANVHDGLIWSDDNEEEVAKGWIIKADTLEELAAKMKSTDIWGNEVVCDAQGLVEQVAEYNAACAAGEDAQFGKKQQKLYPIATPPFYAIEFVTETYYTQGGLKTDNDSRVLSFSNQPIERLYAAGDIAHDSPLYVICSHGGYARAQIAVEHAATLSPWDE